MIWFQVILFFSIFDSIIAICWVIPPLILWIALYARKLTKRTAELRFQRKRAQALLHEMLPKSVAYRLQRGMNVPAEHFDMATIYFSDIVGFTDLSAARSPMEIVDLLNTLYMWVHVKTCNL